MLLSALVVTSAWIVVIFFFSSRRRHTRFDCDWSSDVCSSDLPANAKDLVQIIGLCQRPMQILGIGRVTAKARVVGGDETRPPCVWRGKRRRLGRGRGGEEGRSRGAPDHLKKKKKQESDLEWE